MVSSPLLLQSTLTSIKTKEVETLDKKGVHHMGGVVSM